jgi:hypothetical protein
LITLTKFALISTLDQSCFSAAEKNDALLFAIGLLSQNKEFKNTAYFSKTISPPFFLGVSNKNFKRYRLIVQEKKGIE